MINDGFSNRRRQLLRLKVLREGRQPQDPARPKAEGVFAPCPDCGRAVSRRTWAERQNVCPHCGFHRPVSAYQRMEQILDPGSFKELDAGLCGGDPLQFDGYPEKLRRLRQTTGLQEAVVCAKGRIGGAAVVIGVMDSRFLMGSMGVAVGEKIARAADTARREKLPLILFCASGGARMQEGILSLMQMAKTAEAVSRFQDAGGLYIACLTHPTTGGVTASFASLADITLAEPGALIGFAGPRVIEQTIGQTLPEGFQRSEYLLEHGFLDAVVPRAELRGVLIRLLQLHGKGGGRRGTAQRV